MKYSFGLTEEQGPPYRRGWSWPCPIPLRDGNLALPVLLQPREENPEPGGGDVMGA
jgi:hypothetical protein